MSYQVVQGPGHAILRQDYDAVFATEAEAQSLLDCWATKYTGVHWHIERLMSDDYRRDKDVPYPVNAEWVDGQVRRLDGWPRRESST